MCEAIRPELNGKSIILGFFGICPNVDLRIPHLDQPTVLTFLVCGGPGDGQFEASFDVVDEAGLLVVATASLPFRATPNIPTNLAPSFLLTFGRAGTFAVRCFVDSKERFRGTFRVAEGRPL